MSPEEIKRWSDRTAWKSNINGLVFPPDRKWTTVTVNMVAKSATLSSATVKATLYTDKEEKSGDVTASWGKTESKQYDIVLNRVCSFYIDGYLQGVSSGGEVIITAKYEEGSVLKSESKTWGDATAGISIINGLYLDATQKWERASITISFKPNTQTGCMVTLLNNGELAYMDNKELPPWADSQGSGDVIYPFNLQCKNKVPLVVDGYITFHPFNSGNLENSDDPTKEQDIANENPGLLEHEDAKTTIDENNNENSVALQGGAATITLTGYYRG